MRSRIQKILAQAGYGSRRSCESLIEQGRVEINGHPAALGDKADPENDQILVDGNRLSPPEDLCYIALHKPRGVLSTVQSPDNRPTVRSLIDLPGRLYPVGRLDLDSEGLILMTNDGDLTNHLTHPRYQHEKEYRLLVSGSLQEELLSEWRKGLVLEDGTRINPVRVWIESQSSKETWLRVILKEGKKRQIRRMAEVSGMKVERLIRVRIATLTLGDLQPGKWRQLKPDEIESLQRLISKKG